MTVDRAPVARARPDPVTVRWDQEERARAAAARHGKPARRLQWDKQRTALLFQRYRSTNDSAPRDELITMYLNLVGYLASKYRGRGEPVDDVVQAGTIGLIKAVDRFDPQRGFEFTTYATPTIIGEIKRHFRDKGWAMRIPRRMQELSVRLNGATDTLTRELQRSPTVSEIAERAGCSHDDVLEISEAASAARSTVPLDAGYASENGDSLSLLEVIGVDDPLLANVDDRDTLTRALEDVSPQAQRAVHLRFFEAKTQTDIAIELGISQMQVSRLLRKALAALRANIVTNNR